MCKQRKRLRKNEEGLREMQDNMKCNNSHIIGIPEQVFKKVMMENFPILMRESPTNPGHRESQSRGTQRGPLEDTS